MSQTKFITGSPFLNLVVRKSVLKVTLQSCRPKAQNERYAERWRFSYTFKFSFNILVSLLQWHCPTVTSLILTYSGTSRKRPLLMARLTGGVTKYSNLTERYLPDAGGNCDQGGLNRLGHS